MQLQGKWAWCVGLKKILDVFTQVQNETMTQYYSPHFLECISGLEWPVHTP